MRLRLKVRAGARRSCVAGLLGGEWKVEIAAPAVNGKANRALVDFFAAELGISRSAVRIVSGEHSPRKVLELPVLGEEAQARLGKLLRR